jgi:hypothetical protein
VDKNTDTPNDKELDKDELPEIKDIPETESPDDSVEEPKPDEGSKLAAVESDETAPVAAPALKSKPTGGRLKRFLHTKKGKIVAVVAAVILILGVLLVIPTTRYAILGTFIKKDVKVIVTDSVTKKPVSEATVTFGTITTKTNGDGVANVANVPVNDYKVKITKGYYKDAEVKYTVPIFGTAPDLNQGLEATGRQVSITVTDKISKAVVAKATVAVKDTSAVTDEKGIATIVLPADQPTLKATIKLDGYNQSEVDVTVTDQADANQFAITPSGTVYFLSKQTGKINVMKSNLDGSDAAIVVEGTGNENDRETVLLAARDWKYMALSANRTGSKLSQIYLVNAETGKLSTIDEGDADFNLIGWSDHRFIYKVTRNKNNWEEKKQSLKSYDADTGNITTIDENNASGTNFYNLQYEVIANEYILEGKVVYVKSWFFGSSFESATIDKKDAIIVVNPKNNEKQRVKEFNARYGQTLQAKLYEPQELYFRLQNGTQIDFYEYEGGSVKTVTNTDNKFFNSFYPTYLISPSGEKTFWHEPRDGKNALFTGDKNGSNSTELGTQSEFSAYGWYSDKYILLSKNGSELYIAPSDKKFDAVEPIKVTNYHKPSLNFPGYGYGYGGNS